MIGVFDSGFGGLTVLKEFLRLLPQYDYIYLGDNARAPYGNRSHQVIYTYTKEAVDFLVSRGCSLIIIACNTASSESLRLLQQEYLPQRHPSIKVLGVIRPTVEEAVVKSHGKTIGIVGTRATVLSRAYVTEIQHFDDTIQVYQQACPLLVPLIEEGWDNKPESRMILKKYLRPLLAFHIDTLILGCTHYPIIVKQFQRKAGKRVTVISSATSTAIKLVDYLHRHPDIEKKIGRSHQVHFCTTDDRERFIHLGSRFLGRTIEEKSVALIHLPGTI